jgi:hypothetical protein
MCVYSYAGCLSPEALAALSAFRAEKADEQSAARQKHDSATAAASDFVSEDYGKSQFWVRPQISSGQ